MNSLNNYQRQLLDEAKAEWSRGNPIDLILFAQLAQEGFDVEALQERYMKAA